MRRKSPPPISPLNPFFLLPSFFIFFQKSQPETMTLQPPGASASPAQVLTPTWNCLDSWIDPCCRLSTAAPGPNHYPWASWLLGLLGLLGGRRDLKKLKGMRCWCELHLRWMFETVLHGILLHFCRLKPWKCTKSIREPSVSVAKVHDFSCSFYTHMCIHILFM